MEKKKKKRCRVRREKLKRNIKEPKLYYCEWMEDRSHLPINLEELGDDDDRSHLPIHLDEYC